MLPSKTNRRSDVAAVSKGASHHHDATSVRERQGRVRDGAHVPGMFGNGETAEERADCGGGLGGGGRGDRGRCFRRGRR